MQTLWIAHPPLRPGLSLCITGLIVLNSFSGVHEFWLAKPKSHCEKDKKINKLKLLKVFWLYIAIEIINLLKIYKPIVSCHDTKKYYKFFYILSYNLHLFPNKVFKIPSTSNRLYSELVHHYFGVILEQ